MIRHAHQFHEQAPAIEVSLETDPVEMEKARVRREQFDLNSEWLQRHIKDVYKSENRGKIVCIAGQEAFIGNTVREAVSLAKAVHPDDQGYFTRYIPRQKVTRIYAT
jgi:hypothetical protein